MENASMGKIRDFGEVGTKPLLCAFCGALLPISNQAVLTCRMCGQGHRSLPPPPVHPQTAFGETAQFQLGDRVAVLWGAHWWTAHVVEVVSEYTCKVHYEGWAPAFDSVVDMRKIRPLDYEPRPSIIPPFDEAVRTGKRSDLRVALGVTLVLAICGTAMAVWITGAFSSSPSAIESAQSSGVESAKMGGIFDRVPGQTLEPGAAIERGAVYFVKWGEGWYRGTVLEVINPNEFVIQYDGWSRDHNEIVTRDKLRALR